MAANGNGGGFDGVAFGDGSATPSRAVAGSSAGGIRASNRSVDKLLDMDTKLEAREVDEPKDDPSEPKPFVERVKEFIKKDYYVPREAIRGEIAAGLVVGLAVVPEAIAFALVVGIKPQVGVDTTLITSIVVGIFGGRPGLCNGASGAIAVVIKDTVADDGEEYMGYTVILAGFFCILFGLLQLPKFMSLISSSVMVGFVNALAIIIGCAQVKGFKRDLQISGTDSGGSGRRLLGGSYEVFFDGEPWVDGDTAAWMLLEAAVCMLTMIFMPKIKHKLAHVIPASLVGILLATVVEHAIVRPAGGRTNTVGDLGEMSGDLPKSLWNRGYDVPPFNSDTLGKILPIAGTLAGVALIEQLMTLQLVNDMTKTTASATREAVGLGLGNVVAGLFGGMGGNAMIGQSVISIRTGGTRRLSNITVGITVLIITVAAFKVVNLIPNAGFIGMMWMICYYTFEWTSFKFIWHAMTPLTVREKKQHLQKIKRVDVVVIVVVTVVTLFSNLAISVCCGVLVNLISYSWDSAKQTRLAGVSMAKMQDPATGEERPVRVYEVEGPLFFGSARKFKAMFDKDSDPDDVEIHCAFLQVMDYSALEAFNAITSDYAAIGKRVHLRFLTEDNHRFLAKGRAMLPHLASWQVIRELGDDEAAAGGALDEMHQDHIDVGAGLKAV